MIAKYLGLAWILAFSLSCGNNTPTSRNALNTDLGFTGNARAIENYKSYQEKSQHCFFNGERPSNETPPHRVLISGFGLFSGNSRNISGAATRAVGLCSENDLRSDCHSLPSETSLRSDEFGGRVIQRTLKVGDTNIEVCAIEVAVQWDLASAIIWDEATRFKPELILMTGLGASNYTEIETQAINDARGGSGYESEGNSSGHLNRPISAKILSQDDQNFVRDLTWRSRDIVQNPRVHDLTVAAGGKSAALSYSTQSGNYVCNNTAYVISAIAASSNLNPVGLFGDQLMLKKWAQFEEPRVGFLHLPLAANSRSDDTPLTIRKLIGEVIASDLSLD